MDLWSGLLVVMVVGGGGICGWVSVVVVVVVMNGDLERDGSGGAGGISVE